MKDVLREKLHGATETGQRAERERQVQRKREAEGKWLDGEV